MEPPGDDRRTPTAGRHMYTPEDRWTRAERVAAGLELPLVLLATPALLFPTPARLIAAVPLLLPWIAIRRRTGEWLPRTPLNPPILILAVMALASLALTPDVAFSLDKVSGVVLGAVTFFAIVRWLDTRQRLRVALAMFALAGGALALVGLAGTHWLDKFPLMAAITQHLPGLIRGVRGAESGFHPNAVAGALLLFLPLQAAMVAVSSRRLHRTPANVAWVGRPAVTAALLVLLLLTGATLLLTQSRGAFSALAGATLVSMFFAGRRPRVLAVVVSGLAITGVLVVGPRAVVNEINAPSGRDMGPLPQRVELWGHAVYAIEDAPFGLGMNMFRRMQPRQFPTSPRGPDPVTDIAHAHNQVLQTALDLGVPGLIAFLSVCVLVLFMVWRTRADSELRLPAAALGTGILAHLGFGLADAIPLGAKVGIVFWWMLAITAAAFTIAHRDPRPVAITAARSSH